MSAPASASAAAAPPAATGTPSVASAPVVAAAEAPPADTEPTCEELKSFKAKMHAAVDAALKYPATLKFKPAAGVTIVTYDYQDGQAKNAHITQWSGDGRLDRSALAAVTDADFASITPGIGHKRIHDVVIIVFDNYKDDGGKNTKEREDKKLPDSDECS
jgi:protein TonB